MNLYLIRVFNENEEFFKIGTSVHKYCRFYQIMKFGYSVEIVLMVYGMTWENCLNTEKILQTNFKQYIPKIKFGGYTECFKNININIYKTLLNNLINEFDYITENMLISWR